MHFRYRDLSAAFPGWRCDSLLLCGSINHWWARAPLCQLRSQQVVRLQSMNYGYFQTFRLLREHAVDAAVAKKAIFPSALRMNRWIDVSGLAHGMQ